jgi:hypothetical protein
LVGENFCVPLAKTSTVAQKLGSFILRFEQDKGTSPKIRGKNDEMARIQKVAGPVDQIRRGEVGVVESEFTETPSRRGGGRRKGAYYGSLRKGKGLGCDVGDGFRRLGASLDG